MSINKLHIEILFNILKLVKHKTLPESLTPAWWYISIKVRGPATFHTCKTRRKVWRTNVICDLWCCTRYCTYAPWQVCEGHRVHFFRRSYLVPTHLVLTHLVSMFCHLLLLFIHNLLWLRTTSLHTFIKENKYLENYIGFIRIKPIVWE